MELFKQIYSWNYILSVALTAWLVAQVLKTIINFLVIGEFDLERMWGAGGMPSAHSATVCALTIACGRYVGTQSPTFAVALVLAAIVMYDAMGVRRDTGEQAKVLNQMISDWVDVFAESNPFLADRKLKEMVGHTPFEVLAGAILGIALGFLIPLM